MIRKVKKARLTVDIPIAAKKRIERLRDESEAATITEVLVRATRVYEMLITNNVTHVVIDGTRYLLIVT